MKKITRVGFRIFVAAFLFSLAANSVSAQIFKGGRESKEDKILREVKKINTRLMEIKTKEIKSMQMNQADLASQVETLKGMIPHLQGAIEQTDARVKREILQINNQLKALDQYLKTEAPKQSRSQKAQLSALNKALADQLNAFKAATDARLDKLEKSLAVAHQALGQDHEAFAASTQQSMAQLADSHTKGLQSVETSLNAQNQRITETITLLSEMAKENVKASQGLTTGHDQLMAGFDGGFAQMKTSTDKMVEILSKTLAEQQELKAKLDAISKDQAALTAQSTFVKDNLIVADGKLSTLKESINTLKVQNQSTEKSMISIEEKVGEISDKDQKAAQTFDKLIESSKQIAAHSQQLETKVDQSVQKIESGQQEAAAINEKITKLIDILKTIATEQEKAAKLLTETGKINAALVDLRNKANVNISRNNKILKKLGK